MIKTIRTIKYGLLRPINPYTPILISTHVLLWGLWLLSPWWIAYTRAPLFSRLNEIAPEYIWGLWSVVAGALGIYYTIKQRPVAMMRALGFISWHWSAVAYFMWLGDWQNTGGLTYSAIALFSIYMFLNVRINYTDKRSNWHIDENWQKIQRKWRLWR